MQCGWPATPKLSLTLIERHATHRSRPFGLAPYPRRSRRQRLLAQLVNIRIELRLNGVDPLQGVLRQFDG